MNKRLHRISWFKRGTVAAVTLSFFVTSLFCCCFAGKVEANSSLKLNKSSSSHCHQSSTSQKSEPQKHKSCDCSKMTGQAADQAIQSFDSNFVLKSFEKIHTLVIRFYRPVFTSLSRADNGPPVSRYSIPIYLQISNLRL